MPNTAKTYNLDQYMTDAQKQLKQKQQSARQAADISYQKLQKYLPQQTAGQSVGMTETAKIAANNAYQRALAEADSDYAADMTELQNYVRTEKQAEEDKAYERAWQEDQRKYERDQATKAEAKSAQDELYGEVMTKIEAGEFNTTTELENYLNTQIDTNGDGTPDATILAQMSPSQQALVRGKLDYYKANPDQVAANKNYVDNYNADGSKKVTVRTSDKASISGYLTNTDAGNDFKVGGYKVELGEVATEGVIPASETQKVQDGTVFEYNGALYIKKNGEIYTVRGRGGKLDSEDYKDALKLFEPSTDAN